jgi:hypothetical protein
MSFWFTDGNILLGPGQSRSVEYWFNNGADIGAQIATPVPYLAPNPELRATGHGFRYDYAAHKFFYWVDLTNRGNDTASFQLRGGGLR